MLARPVDRTGYCCNSHAYPRASDDYRFRTNISELLGPPQVRSYTHFPYTPLGWLKGQRSVPELYFDHLPSLRTTKSAIRPIRVESPIVHPSNFQSNTSSTYWYHASSPKRESSRQVRLCILRELQLAYIGDERFECLRIDFTSVLCIHVSYQSRRLTFMPAGPRKGNVDTEFSISSHTIGILRLY